MSEPAGLNLIFHSIGPGGGMERYVLDLIGACARRELALRVIARRVAWPDSAPQAVEFVILRDLTPLSRLNTLRFETTATRHIRPGWPTIAISRVPGDADVAIVGGTHAAHLRDIGKTRPGWFDRLTIAREQSLYAGAHVVIAHSKRVRQEILRHYSVPAEKVVTLCPPVDTQQFNLAARDERDAVRRRLGIQPGEFLLLFPSNNHALKGAELILAALDGYDPRVVLAVAGKAPLAHPRARNLGYRSDMPALYAAADASILASRYEAFGLVGPESILCGTPVLLADTVGAVDVLSPTACLRFSRTVPSLRAALDTALARFDAGTLVLSDPGAHIHYPYSVDAHRDAVLAQLPS
jgi:glycosyltransferase involved in cell wall biosynthesis